MKKFFGRWTAADLVINLFLLIMALTTIVPFVYMVFTSLRQVYTMTDFSFSLADLNFDNYVTIWKKYPFPTYFKNTTFVVILCCLLNVVFGAMAGYGFAKKKFRGRDKIFSLFLATMMIPSQVTMIPVFTIFNKMGLLNTYTALILPSVTAFGVFMMRQFMLGVPDELLEAARLDGANEFQTFIQIVIPLIKPTIISLTIYTFISEWNNFLWPLIAVSDEAHTTLTLGLSTLTTVNATNYGLLMAGSTLTFLVPFLLYIFLQKQFQEGIALSGVKG